MIKKVDLEKLVVYDLETMVNMISGCFTEYKSGQKKEFVLFDDGNQFLNLFKFLKGLRRTGYTMISFNGIGFDNQIVEYILEYGQEWIDNSRTVEDVVSLIYNKAQWIIGLPDEEKFKELLPEFKFTIPAIDLYKQKHYDRPQKATSLKWLQFSMRYPNIEEMPIEHDTVISKEDIPKILSYNWNDVDSTLEFFNKVKFETDLRIYLSENYKLNLINAAEPRLAREIFGKYLCEEMDITYSELKKMQTLHKNIKVKNILFDYYDFENPVFKDIHYELTKLVLTPEQKFEKVIDVYGLPATLALGGLHSNNSPIIVKEDKDNIIITSDVASMYPNLAIQNDLKPAHLGNTFSKIYNMLYQERKKYDKKNPMNYVIKIILNSAYGLSSEKNSYLYDVAFTRAICLNGELSLLMLCEFIKRKIPEARFIMLNTDGCETIIPRSKKDLYFEACAEWEKITKLVLEHGQYEKMVINDCNNYIAVDTKGYVKRKGMFEYDMDFHKNPSFLVIPKALEAYFIEGKDYKEFIKNHKDIYDFFGAVKKKSNFKLSLYKLENNVQKIEPQQKVTRFFVAKNGGKLVKDFHDGRQTKIMADWQVQPCNRVEDINYFENLNYTFYIKEVEKIIHSIEGNKQQLTLF